MSHCVWHPRRTSFQYAPEHLPTVSHGDDKVNFSGISKKAYADTADAEARVASGLAITAIRVRRFCAGATSRCLHSVFPNTVLCLSGLARAQHVTDHCDVVRKGEFG